VELGAAREVMHRLVDVSKEFKMAGPEGYEDILVLSPETGISYFKSIEITEYTPGNFGLIVYVYSQDFDERTLSTSKFEKILNKFAKVYDRQNVKLARDGNKFFLGVGLFNEETDLRRVLDAFSELAMGVLRLEELLNKKLGLDLFFKS
jgi:hypothetical protein